MADDEKTPRIDEMENVGWDALDELGSQFTPFKQGSNVLSVAKATLRTFKLKNRDRVVLICPEGEFAMSPKLAKEIAELRAAGQNKVNVRRKGEGLDTKYFVEPADPK